VDVILIVGFSTDCCVYLSDASDLFEELAAFELLNMRHLIANNVKFLVWERKRRF